MGYVSGPGVLLVKLSNVGLPGPSTDVLLGKVSPGAG